VTKPSEPLIYADYGITLIDYAQQ